MDHQVEDDGDVRPARHEGREAMALDEARPVQVRQGRQHRRVEALDVAHHQLAPPPRRLGDDRLARGQVLRQGLLDEQV
ncbi:hypothetical protein FJ251_15275, partial [bacterium]|nr:hypothetical protein [bacterium]